jgi:hypothetical protein
MYHFFIVYFSAFLPFSFYLPFHFYNELYCITFIFLLIYIFDFEEIRDLVNIIIFTLLSLFSDLGVFLVYYLIFVFLSTFEKMQQKKSKTTVFFKKKNIPFRILIGYFGLFLVSIAFISIFDFFGNKSVSVIANRIFNVSIPVIFLVLVHFVLQLLIRLEEGAPEYVGALCILIASLGVGYYTFYLPQGENLDSLKNSNLKFFTAISLKIFTINSCKLINKRTRGNRTEYLVQWKGYAVNDATWEYRSKIPKSFVETYEEENQ